MRVRLVLAMTAALLAGRSALGAEAPVLRVDAATQTRLGIATAPVAAARRQGSVQAYATGLDALPLATLDADIIAAAFALQASQAEADRTRALNAADAAVSTRAAEAAAAQAKIDASKLAFLRRRIGLEWGAGFGQMSDANRAALITDLAAGRAALVRIDAVGGMIPASGSLSLDLGPYGPVSATIVGPSRAGDPKLQSSGVVGIVRGAQAARIGIGQVIPVNLAMGGGQAGVLAPREAVLRNGGETFVYVRKDATGFERRTLTGTASLPSGLFAASGLKAGEAVVVRGASALYAAENPAPKEEE